MTDEAESLDDRFAECKEVLASAGDGTLLLVDIPASIECAQGSLCDRKIVSSEPIHEPFHAPEPKSRAAADKLRNQAAADKTRQRYAQILHQAQTWARRLNREGHLICRPRRISIEIDDDDEPVKASERAGDESRPANGSTQQIAASEMVRKAAMNRSKHSTFFHEQNAINLTIRNGPPAAAEADRRSIRAWSGRIENNSNTPKTLIITDCTSDSPTAGVTFEFMIPARCCSVLGDCSSYREFRDAGLTTAGPAKFDLLVLDPPWSNSSVSRKRNYSTASTMDDLTELLEGMHIGDHVSANGFIAVWVTNRPAFRRLLLGPGGLFERWQVSLAEEWIWLKVTDGGEPVSPIDGLWRKPYEVLLIGRRRPHAASNDSVAKGRQRVLVAVADLHSRKPCIKGLAKQLLFADREHFAAAEFFARYPVEGWTSWGNEVIQYAWSGCWSDQTGHVFSN